MPRRYDETDEYALMQQVNAAESRLATEKTLRYIAQGLVHQLAQALEERGGIPEALVDAVAQERIQLLDQRRRRSMAEATRAREKANAIANRMKRVRDLGGSSTMIMEQQRKLHQQEARRIDALTDAELLG